MIYDTVIMGAGLSGLMCGYILSKEGQNICIVEKNSTVGGSIQKFERNGINFDTGAHYIGGLGEKQNLYRYFKYFNLINRLKLKKLNSQGFDIIRFFDKEYKYAEGDNNFLETLAQSFPKERKAIKTYIEKLKSITKKFPLYNLDTNFKEPLNNIFSVNACKYISSLTSNKKLINVLTGTNLLYSGEPDKTPLYLHALINYGYMESAWRVVGGSGQIADILSNSIKSFGGKIYTSSKVKKIETNNEKITAVELKNGEKIKGKNFISTIHPAITINLIKTKLLRKSYRNRVNNIKNTESLFSVYVIFKKNSFKYYNSNFYCFNDNNSWVSSVNYNEKTFGKSLFFMTSATTENDSFAQSGIILTRMNFSDVLKWKNTIVEKRGREYKEFKIRKAEQIFENIEKHFPDFCKYIYKYYTATPLTYRDYTATKNGSAYGILKNSNEPYNMVLPVTKIPNLYFAGQNINAHGVHGVTISAVVACSYLLGEKYLINKIKKS